ncbi:hypothetical protein PFBG_02077 [Plasmodium falciparum 7G8]|uniref:Uncharacterized protein n=1 Tax=Plasmodium falciparum (isolate 7G8) TaxID=57266 RepID=W7FGK6_PLAF8|nr:hypothetical protein PFBG_02077 [Plasmodium falciparum 7G8]
MQNLNMYIYKQLNIFTNKYVRGDIGVGVLVGVFSFTILFSFYVQLNIFNYSCEKEKRKSAGKNKKYSMICKFEIRLLNKDL